MAAQQAPKRARGAALEATVTTESIPGLGGVTGMFVRAVIEEGVDEDAILVPQAALSRTPEGEGQVIVVDETGQTRPQTVATQRAVGNEWVVTGLEPGTMIVTSGFQHFRPGDTVSVRGPQSQRAQGRVASAALF